MLLYLIYRAEHFLVTFQAHSRHVTLWNADCLISFQTNPHPHWAWNWQRCLGASDVSSSVRFEMVTFATAWNQIQVCICLEWRVCRAYLEHSMALTILSISGCTSVFLQLNLGFPTPKLGYISYFSMTLLWRHNGRGSVSNHQPHDCLLNRFFRRRSKKTSKLRATGLCAGTSTGTGEFPAQMASNVENVSIWWRHHGIGLQILCI